MTQPSNQPPQGGFGAPYDPFQNPPGSPGASPGASPGGGQGGGAGGGYPNQPVTPPPPPGQPPQGGFGAPQPPPQIPAAPPPGQQPQPPAGPGYGYPQQQPTADNPYAGPSTQPQQPGPYGRPMPPGYGYPQQGQYPDGPGMPGGPGAPGGGGKGPFKGRTAAIIGAAVAVLLVAGGVVWAVAGGDDGRKEEAGGDEGAASPGASAPANPGDGGGDPDHLNAGRQAGEDKVLWYKPTPDAPGSGADAPGMWITDTVAVKAAYRQIFAYKVADGTPAYDPISLPQAICSASRQVSQDGKVVVAYKSGTTDSAKCDQLVQIDLKTGKRGWTKKVEDGGLFDSALSVELSIVKNTLIVARDQSGIAFDVADGRQLWTKKKEKSGVCFPSGFTGGDRIILALSCAAGEPSQHERVEELDPTSGRTRWTRDLPKGWQLSRVYSTSPVVLYLTDEDKKQWNISTLKDNSNLTRSQVDVNESFAPECGWASLDRDLQGCVGVAADADILYLPTEAKTGANEIVAINLATGKEKWRVRAPGGTGMLPMKVEGGNLIAYECPSYDKGGRVLSIPTGGDHRAKTVLQNPGAAAEAENGFYSKAVDYVDGRFYLSTTRLTGSDKAREKLMMAFGN